MWSNALVFTGVMAAAVVIWGGFMASQWAVEFVQTCYIFIVSLKKKLRA